MSVVWQQQTHGILRRKQHLAHLLTRLFVFAVLILTLLGAAYLGLVASNVHTASQIWALEQELLEVQRQNQALWVDLARASSIPVLQERSVRLGYQPADSVDFLHVEEP